jgi:hypothetical protein
MITKIPVESEGVDSEALKELASIARLISYARLSAVGLKADFPVWCLDLALGAVLQEMYAQGDQPSHFAGKDAGAFVQRH